MPLLWKRILFALLTFITIVIIIAIYFNFHLKPLLTKKIKEAIITSTDSLYTIDFDDVSANIITGNVSFTHILFKPDTFVYKKLIRKRLAPKHLYRIQVSSLILNQLHPLKVYFNRNLQIGALVINKPIVRMIYQNVPDSQDTIADDKRTLYQRLSKYLKSVKIGDIIFHDVDFQYIDKSLKDNQEAGLKNLDIKINDFLIDSISQFDKSRFYYTKNIFVQLKDNQWLTNDGNYAIQLKELTASTANGFATLRGLSLIPRYSEMGFAERIKVRKDRYSIKFNEISLQNINYKDLLIRRRIIASSLSLNNGSIAVFANRALPKPAIIIDKARNFPSIAFKRLSLPILIDTIKLNNSSISYSGYSPESKQKGTVSFNQLNGQFYNVTNDSLSLLKNKYSKADITALIMGSGRVNLHLNFSLNAPDGAFTYNGNVGKMNARVLNRVTGPLGLIEIKSGKVQEMSFSGKGSIAKSEGKVTLLYNNLKVALLKNNADSTHLKKKGVASLFVNIFIIKTDNPIENNLVRIANFNYKRPLNISFFNMFWKGLLRGIMEIIGFDEQTKKAMQNKIQQMNIEKIDRAERREKRKARRIERKRIKSKKS